jgi:hypothetical protein
MIDTLRPAECIERELNASPELDRAAAHLAKAVAEEATRGLATKDDLRLLKAQLALARLEAWLSTRVGAMLAAAVTILLAGIAVSPPLAQWVVRA